MIKAIIFDWGGVLTKQPTKELMDYFAKELKINIDKFYEAWKKYETSFQKGKISEEKLWQNICYDLNIPKPKNNYLWIEGVKSVFKNRPHIFHITRILKNKGYKIGLLSNTELPSVKYFKDNNFDKYFDETIFSCIEGTVKPEEKIYKLSCQKLNIKATEAIFIDDMPKNIKAAKKVGLHTIQFFDENKLRKDLDFLL